MEPSKNILGLKIRGHDPGAALMSGNRVVAISEERLTREKHARDAFPHRAIAYCLDAFSLAPENIDLVVMDEIDVHDGPAMEAIFRKENRLNFSHAKVTVINHHLAHAASAFYCSPFDEAAIMVVDGTGSRIQTHCGSAWETDTLYRGTGNEIQEIQKTAHQRFGRAFPETCGIGLLYTLITRSYLSFGRYQEGKTMGLASYGNADNIFKIIPKARFMKELNGHFVCNPNISAAGFLPPFLPRFFRFPKKTLAQRRVPLLLALRRMILRTLAFFIRDAYRPIFSPVRLPHRARKKDELPSGPYNDAAALVQDIIEDVFLGLSRRVHTITDSQNLCIAGGCGLNGVSNNKILHDKKFKNIFVQPASSDTGIPLGCALWGHHAHFKQPRQYVMTHAYLGRKYTEQEVAAALQNASGISYRKSGDVAQETAKLLADEKIVGWFQGGSEYGPRALGHRSILCDPRKKRMKDTLNARVKHREMWRPFAASVLKEYAKEYFDLPTDESPYMLLVPDMRKEVRGDMQALVHIDGTCRIQTVTKEDNGLYYDLIDAFRKETGVPLILNTSFNLAGEPIVETPEDALKCFLKTQMDALIVGSYVVKKEDETINPERKD